MAKKRLSIIVAIFAGMMLLFNSCTKVLFNSCTKVSEKYIIGKWEVISYQRYERNGYDGWIQGIESPEEVSTITFHSDGSYTEVYGDGNYHEGTWIFSEGLQQIKFDGVLLDVYRYTNKEMEWRRETSDYAEKTYLKKIK